MYTDVFRFRYMFNVSIREYFSLLNVFIVYIHNTTMFKLITLLCTHVHSYMFSTVHPRDLIKSVQHGGQGDMHVTSSWDWIANFVAAGRQGVRSDTSGTGHTDNDPVLCASTCVSFGSIPGDQTQPHPHHHHRRCRMGRGHCRGGRLYCLLAGNWLSYQVIMHSMTKLSWNLYPANWLNVHLH